MKPTWRARTYGWASSPGMFFNADSGLYPTKYRVFDPVAGRWLSRDPFGEPTDPNANLYPYVGGQPIGKVDPLGSNPLAGAAVGAEKQRPSKLRPS